MNKRIVYIVSIILTVVLLTTSLVACVPSSVEKGKAKLEKAHFNVSVIDNPTNNIDATLFAEKTIMRKNEEVNIKLEVMYFSNVDDAKTKESNIGEKIDYYKGIYGELTVYGRTNNVVFVGDKDAVKSFRG